MLEFLAIKTLVMASVNFSIVDVSKPLLLSSDASFSAYGGQSVSGGCLVQDKIIIIIGLAQQYTDTPKYYSPDGPVINKTDDDSKQLVTVGCFSRGFSKGFLIRAIVYKYGYQFRYID